VCVFQVKEEKMSALQALEPDSLTDAIASPGIARHMAFRSEDSVVLRSQSQPGVISGWHTHGDYDVYGYVASGICRLESDQGEKDAITVGPGGFLHVPPHTVHREINPSKDESNEVILFLRGSGQMVYNLDEKG
jgi:quercetin dioxygenase-like cupin family protein